MEKSKSDQHRARIMNELADSVLTLSDGAILEEIRAAGANPHEEAERTRSALRDVSQLLENVSRQLLNLGHRINRRYWQPQRGGFYNDCLDCGSSVSFTPATGDMGGEALHRNCPGRDHASCRAASRK